MAVAVTATSTPQTTAAASDPHTFTSLINLPDTTGMALVVIASDSNAGQTIDGQLVGATLGGQTVTKIDARFSGDDNSAGFIWIGRVFHSLIGSTGNKDLVVDLGASGLSLLAGVVCVSGQDNATPVGTPSNAAAQTGTPAVTVNGADTGDLAIAGHCDGTSLTTTNQTQRWVTNLNSASGSGNFACNTAAGTGAGISMTVGGSNESWASVGVAIKQASAAATLTQTKFRVYNDDGFIGPEP
jgi:hypothetical protein